MISGVQVLSMLVSYTDEEPNHSRKTSSDDYCSCEGEDRYKVSVGSFQNLDHITNKYHSNILGHFFWLNWLWLESLLPSSPRYISSIIDYYPDLLTPAAASHVPLNLAKMQWETPRHSPSHASLVCLFVFHAIPERRGEERNTNWIVFVASFQCLESRSVIL